ncbi:MAG TPA: 6-bladed beta-propeller [Anaerolineales bacterium]
MLRKMLFIVLMFGLLVWMAGAAGGPAQALARTVSPSAHLASSWPVFSHERTFGETGVAYLADTGHLDVPVGVGLDGAGNLWVVEGTGTRALKYSTGGTFLMSIGTAGLVDVADETHFAGPVDVAVDSDGDMWVADFNSHRVAKFGSTGTYLTQLGITWESGSDDAHFDGPVGIAFDSAGNIYVSDRNNHRVQVFDSSGFYSATIGVAGEAGADNDHFDIPLRIAIDDDDYLYVVDVGNQRVQIFDASHAYTATLGVAGVPGSDNDHLDSPRGVAVDGSFIYVADANNHRVQIFDRTTYTYQDTLGSWGSGQYEFNMPRDVAVDSSGNLFVADSLNYRVQKFNNSLAYALTIGTTGVPYVTDGYHYNTPRAVAVDASGNIAIVEDEGRGHRLIKLDAGGVPQFTVGVPGVWGDDNEHFNDARGVAFDAEGNLYVADSANHRIQIFGSDGAWKARLGTGWGTGNYEFNVPLSVAIDSNGYIYVADAGNYRVQIYDSDRVYVGTIGVTGVSGTDNDHLYSPWGVAVDANGNVYVADTLLHRVQKFDKDGAWLKTLGTAGKCGSAISQFCEPYDVAVDAAGKLYVAEKFNPRVQVFDGTGAYLATIGGEWGSQDGQFRQALGVDVDTEGNVYVADTLNHRVEKYAPGAKVFVPLAVRGSP